MRSWTRRHFLRLVGMMLATLPAARATGIRAGAIAGHSTTTWGTVDAGGAAGKSSTPTSGADHGEMSAVPPNECRCGAVVGVHWSRDLRHVLR
jgi:hypothetical protein